MRQGLLTTFSFCVLVLFFARCRDVKDITCTGVKGFRINKINTQGIDGDVLIGIKNPNAFGFSIYKSAFDVSYSGVYLGKAKLAKRVFIKANVEEVYSFNLSSDFKNTGLSDIMKLLSGATFKNTIEVKGTLNAGKFYLKKKIPVHVKEKISLE